MDGHAQKACRTLLGVSPLVLGRQPVRQLNEEPGGSRPMALTLMGAMMSRNALASGLPLFLSPNRTLARSG